MASFIYFSSKLVNNRLSPLLPVNVLIITEIPVFKTRKGVGMVRLKQREWTEGIGHKALMRPLNETLKGLPLKGLLRGPFKGLFNGSQFLFSI
jgi:hypothetical protein